MNNIELRKRRITDFFTSQGKNNCISKKTRKSDSFLSELKCPGKKIFDNEVLKIEKVKRRKKIEKDHENSQTILYCGQSKIGNIFCKQCEMVYCVDSVEDCQKHQQFHNRFEKTESFQLNNKIFQILNNCCKRKIGNHEIFYIGNKNQIYFKKAINNWLKLIDEEIGYCGSDKIWNIENKKRIFLCLSKKNESEDYFLSGLLVIDRLSEAMTENSKEIIKEDLQQDWIVGVDRIWTHQSQRRTSIASCLLDSATVFDKEMEYRKRRLRVAFCDLTLEGRKFAEKYVKTRYSPDEQYSGQLLIY